MASTNLSLTAYLESLDLPQDRVALRKEVIPTFIHAVRDIAEVLRKPIDIGTIPEEIIRAAAVHCPYVHTESSKDFPNEERVWHPAHLGSVTQNPGMEQYTIAYNALDGDSEPLPNWTMGTIIGIWDGTTALKASPRMKFVAAILGIYGPRTTAIVALRIPGTAGICFELAIYAESTEVVHPHIQFQTEPSTTRYFTPANLLSGDPLYMALVWSYFRKGYTLRYSGRLLPDVVHALVTGQGIYLSPVTPGSEPKLNRLYELTPVALVVECAGGKALNLNLSTLGDYEITLARAVEDCDERAGVIFGSGYEVLNAVSTVWYSVWRMNR
jgi:sedoheptulose-bisphosphatase